MRKFGKYKILSLVAVLLCLAAAVAEAQRGRFRGPSINRREVLPEWELDREMPSDVFTFARVEYDSESRWGGWWDKWTIDYPDADYNLSYRLQELTSLKVHPRGRTLRLTDKDLWNYPFIYIVEPGDMYLSDQEVETLRRYLLNGGFLMVDDFWGDREWRGFYRQIKKVFPNRELVDLPPDHAIFTMPIPIKARPQIPNIARGTYSQWDGVTWEPDKDPGAHDPHYRAFLDDQGRIMVIVCHNTDNGDGWEREGENEYYFREFSEKKAYPLAINILFYAMTH